MMASLFAGVSGLRNHQVKMNVVGDNIANVNTIGFKMGRTTFQEALVQTMRSASRPTTTSGGTNPLQLGLGMSLASIDNIFQQGGLESTGQVTDLAIQGSGFFVLSDGDQEYYTRAGAFGFDADSNMVNPGNGFILQGKMADVDGTIPASAVIGSIVMPFGQQDPARATTEIELGMNLNATATDAVASLVSTGTSNVTNVSGSAVNGSGGTHTITITGENAAFSQLSGTHARVLTDVTAAGGYFTTAPSLPGAGGNFTHEGGVGGTDDYIYTIIAVNGLGRTQYIDESTVTVGTVGLGEVVTVDWSGYTDIADATSLQIYRRYTGTQYGESCGDPTENGLVAEIDLNTIDPGTNLPVTEWVDDGSSSIRIAAPSTINTTTSITGDESLSAFGVTNATNLQISVDSGNWVTLTQLTHDSTINDLIARINSSVTGVTASIVDNQVEIKRDYAGDPSIYNVRMRDSSYSDALTDFGAGDVALSNGGGGSLSSATDYKYAIVASNSRGDSKAYVYTRTTGAGETSILLDWTAFGDLGDATSVKIYRGTVDASDPNNEKVVWDGMIANVSVSSGTTFDDIGSAATSGEPPFVNSTTPNNCFNIFGTATFNVNNGLASTLEATDVFTPEVTGIALAPETLTLVTNSITGIITGISSIGGGGVTVSAGSGGLVGDPDGTGPLSSSTLVIDAEDTQHATSITAYDSQGGKHTITITFTKSWVENEWFWDASTTGTEVVRSGSSGMVTFNDDGSLGAFTMDGGATSMIIDPNNGAQQMSINLLTGTPSGFDGVTSFSSTSTAAARSQDGYGLGVLSNIAIDAAGNITGMFTNGVSRILAQIYIAEFNNPAGLAKAGRNMYQSTGNSGDAMLGGADTSTSTTISSGALEISNVDMAQEFTSMIIAQRGFQANARVITTSDDMLTELVNLKR